MNGTIWDDLEEGLFNIEIFANDTFGHVNNSYVLTLYKDITPPNININSPNNNTYYGLAPDILLFATDVSIDAIWYSVEGTIRTLTNGISEPLDSNIWDNLPQGEFQVFIFANDTAGNLNNTLMVTLFKDTLAPLINVNLPFNNTYWNSMPTINVEAFDPNLDEINYSVGVYSVMLENGIDTTFDFYIFHQILDEGPFILEIFAKDIFGHINDSIKITLYKDTTPPNIDIDSPQPNDIFGENTPLVSLNVSDTNLEDVWYRLSNGTVVTNNYPWTGSIEQVVWDQVGNGTVTIRFYANDSATNTNNEYVIVRKNIYAPIITIDSQIIDNNDLFGIAAPNFLIYKSGSELNSTWYTLDDGITNTTFTGLSGTINQTVWDNVEIDIITLRFYINDSFGKIGFDEVSIRKDADMPIIIVNSPIDSPYFNSRPRINITAIDPNLHTLWYRVGTTNIILSSDIEELLNGTIWDDLAEGPFNIEIFANDTMGNLNYFNTLYLSKDTTGPGITIILPAENQKVDRSAPYFELSIFDETEVDSCWYTIDGAETTTPFTGWIGRIDPDLWEQIWDNLDQGDIITIKFYAKDTLGNEDYAELTLIVEKPVELPKFLSDPLGLIFPALGLVVMIPSTIRLTKSSYYKSLNNKNKKKFRKVLITAGFFLSLITLYFIF